MGSSKGQGVLLVRRVCIQAEYKHLHQDDNEEPSEGRAWQELVLTPKEDLPLGDRLQACYEAKKCGLAGARGSQQRNDLVGGKVKRGILNSLENLVLDGVVLEEILNLQLCATANIV